MLVGLVMLDRRTVNKSTYASLLANLSHLFFKVHCCAWQCESSVSFFAAHHGPASSKVQFKIFCGTCQSIVSSKLYMIDFWMYVIR